MVAGEHKSRTGREGGGWDNGRVMRRRVWAAVVAGAFVVVGLGSVGSPARGATANVSISVSRYVPKTVTVNVGDRVVWTNQDPYGHTVTWSDGSGSSPLLGQGATYSRTFASPGTFAYYCTEHNTMEGTVVVQGSSSPPSTSPPTTKAPTATTAKPATQTTARASGATTTTAASSGGGINPDAYATGDSSTTTSSTSSTTSTTTPDAGELAAEKTGSSGGGAAIAIFAAAVVLAAILGALLWRRRGAGPAA